MYGTADGVYLSDVDESYREPSKALALRDVAQVDVLEELLLLIVLSGSFPLLLQSFIYLNASSFRGPSPYFPA